MGSKEKDSFHLLSAPRKPRILRLLGPKPRSLRIVGLPAARGCLRTAFFIDKMIGGRELCFFAYQIMFFSWPTLMEKLPLVIEY